MVTLVLAYAVVAVGVPWALGRHRRVMACAAAVLPAVTVGWALARAGDDVTETVGWASELGLAVDLRLDALAVVMLVLVGGVGAVVLCYSGWYFERAERLMTGTLVAFAGAMTGLVLADNLLVLYVFWELTTVSSFILIGAPRPDLAESRRAATQALLTTTAFGLVMLVGFVLLGQAGGTYRISVLVHEPPGGAAADAGVVLVLLGAFAKSAQVPLHAWLPAAMVAPTPVSAYLHAAAMVKAGVYLVARLAPGFAETGVWRPMVVVAGLVSLVVGGLVALRQDDLKRLLAYGTVSQLGLLMVLLGHGTPTAALAGIALLLGHGLFKAPLFLAAGALEHQTGTRRAECLSGAGRRLPVLAVAGTAAVASMIGLPPFLGFVAKEAAFEAFAHGGVDAAVLGGVVAGSALTVAYGVRFLHGAFGGASDGTPGGEPWGLVLPVVVLAVAGFALGVYPGPVRSLIEPYVGVADYELALWHGLGLPIGLSVLAFVVGAGLYVMFGRSFPAKPVWRSVPDAQRVYDGVIEGVYGVAHAVTKRLQIGSLPVYLAVIGVMVLVLPGTALVVGLIGGDGPSSGTLRAWDDPVQPVLAAVVGGCAIAVVRARRRLSAALLLAGVGYGMGGLFVVHGGPDLALTLLVVETLSLIMLVLVLRRFPDRFPPRRRRAPAGVISLCLGGFVATFLVMAALSRNTAPVGPRYETPAAEEEANNVVNLILVELRALDTLGEITVLAVVAMGVSGLMLSRPGGWRPVRPPTAGEEAAREPRKRWLATPGRPPLGGSSVVLEAAARLLGPTILVFSLYLLIAGHGRPGGGFVGGLVAGMAYVLRYLPGGRRELATAVPVRPSVLLGGGLGLAVATGAAAWTSGGQFLQGDVWDATVPVLGEVKVPTSLFFDAGVYLLVLGLVLTILATLGASLEDDT
ncbi:multisubunit sodium/proton antiporter MrpA subunit /multisubunit sodium/proton antiporter MrpB subunit [Actinomadura pelletieri DSM 43383]|uniref:Multisubunit sodium/proton antiporter MrpA subunit /multisubunit sodium/proton antiporter MrpB subunit n=1 Tax=Actinomadura pelletieri DSM 43383 TaxID=1120940 RepID=A0A495QPA7_9ACTN|nr:hydrogen gas-evolving membrane-bound hydrogenase subunit E [Actinomadura pelletieri]RKS74795.1 multisubunit sodium/proton antiporter MrpA subunit /multisubunit sodium/proton antiporter MrpB subunit [Actinomadura pelletieri DSM 43383]